MITIADRTYEPTETHIAIHSELTSMDELRALSEFSKLQSINFADSNVDDDGLKIVAELHPALIDLSLQATRVTDQGLSALDTFYALRSLRLKENEQLTNACVKHIVALSVLEHLGVHYTSIDIDGVQELLKLPKLTFLVLHESNGVMDLELLKRLSTSYPDCEILIKNSASIQAGEIVWRA